MNFDPRVDENDPLLDLARMIVGIDPEPHLVDGSEDYERQAAAEFEQLFSLICDRAGGVPDLGSCVPNVHDALFQQPWFSTDWREVSRIGAERTRRLFLEIWPDLAGLDRV